jgi:hypothetical protein
MKRKVFLFLIVGVMVLTLFPLTAAAQNHGFSFSVSPSQNNGVAWSAGNPKDDNEQASYVNTTSSNIISSDRFYYRVWRSPSLSGTAMTNYARCTGTGSLRLPFITGRSAGKGTYLYLEADTDVLSVSVTGYWYS